MDHLWSPWRMKYIQRHEHVPGCVFCTAVELPDGPGNLILARGELAFVILNRFPYTSGHLMVVPFEHEASFELLEPAVHTEIMGLLTRAMGVLRAVYNPDGFNVGANIGASAGAGVADHVHFHIVPRWGGDANFMTTLAQTRVLPEALEDTYLRLHACWNEPPRSDDAGSGI
jgi:ATP adenylyltransferase